MNLCIIFLSLQDFMHYMLVFIIFRIVGDGKSENWQASRTNIGAAF